MNQETARKLCQLNTSFYQGQYESFAQTRARPWQGWNTCLGHVKDILMCGEGEGDSSCDNGTGTDGDSSCTNGTGTDDGLDNAGVGVCSDGGALSVLDLACGNLRFKAFLEASLPRQRMDFYAVDNCDELAAGALQAHYQNLDIIKALLQGLPLAEQLIAPVCDLSVSFGFLHHVPLRQQREEVLLSLIEKTRPGGLVIVTLWQFLKDSAFAEKAQAVHKRGVEELGLIGLEENDFLLGWKDTPGVYRYCHSFADSEVDELAAAVSGRAMELDRFTADGRTDSLNTYLVLQIL